MSNFNKSICKSCGHIVSVDAKVCQNCGDVDPLNKKAIRSLAFKMNSVSNIKIIFMLILILVGFSFLILHYFGTEKWYMVIVIPFLISIIISITGIDIEGPFISYKNRLKFTEMIQQSFDGFIEANCKELYRHPNKNDEHFYIDILRLFVEKVMGSDRVSVMDISSITLGDCKSFVNDKIENCDKESRNGK